MPLVTIELLKIKYSKLLYICSSALFEEKYHNQRYNHLSINHKDDQTYDLCDLKELEHIIANLLQPLDASTGPAWGLHHKLN